MTAFQMEQNIEHSTSNFEVRMGSGIIAFRALLENSVLSSLRILVPNAVFNSTVLPRNAIDFGGIIFPRSAFDVECSMLDVLTTISPLAPPKPGYVCPSVMSECQTLRIDLRSSIHSALGVSSSLRENPSSPTLPICW